MWTSRMFKVLSYTTDDKTPPTKISQPIGIYGTMKNLTVLAESIPCSIKEHGPASCKFIIND